MSLKFKQSRKAEQSIQADQKKTVSIPNPKQLKSKNLKNTKTGKAGLSIKSATTSFHKI